MRFALAGSPASYRASLNLVAACCAVLLSVHFLFFVHVFSIDDPRRNTKKKKKECPRNSRKTRKNRIFSVSSVDTLSFSSSYYYPPFSCFLCTFSVRSLCPEGAAYSSPGLRRQPLPWVRECQAPNPNGVASGNADTSRQRRNPFRVVPRVRQTQGSGWRRNPGL